jgi:hypothetical protein
MAARLLDEPDPAALRQAVIGLPEMTTFDRRSRGAAGTALALQFTAAKARTLTTAALCGASFVRRRILSPDARLGRPSHLSARQQVFNPFRRFLTEILHTPALSQSLSDNATQRRRLPQSPANKALKPTFRERLKSRLKHSRPERPMLPAPPAGVGGFRARKRMDKPTGPSRCSAGVAAPTSTGRCSRVSALEAHHARRESFARSRPRQEPLTMLGLNGSCRSLAELRQESPPTPAEAPVRASQAAVSESARPSLIRLARRQRRRSSSSRCSSSSTSVAPRCSRIARAKVRPLIPNKRFRAGDEATPRSSCRVRHGRERGSARRAPLGGVAGTRHVLLHHRRNRHRRRRHGRRQAPARAAAPGVRTHADPARSRR